MRGLSQHPAFMGNCSTISHTFSVLSTQWMSSLKGNEGREVSPRFQLIVFVLSVNQENQETEGVQYSLGYSQWWNSHLEFRQTSKTELLRENSQRA